MQTFTLEYWLDEGWYVGRLKEVAGVMSQGQTLPELEENIRDAYHLMPDTEPAPTSSPVLTRQIEVSRLNRGEFIRELTRGGCYLVRHGARHDIYENGANKQRAPVPRHAEIKNSLCRLIRRQPGLPEA
jgi:hypothetical protein